jgi:MoxR-like ATPase
MESKLYSRFVDEISKKYVGNPDLIRLMLVALLSQGHILLEGNPGLGKTTLAKAFAETIGGDFKRIQMTPDLLPADILGTHVYDQRSGTFELRKGPIFANLVLVDELNRATPKAQAALLEAMQERQVTLEGETMKLGEPFMVIATQMQYGTAGTYPLSEVQSDRFALSVQVGYPSAEDELKIISGIDAIEAGNCEVILNPVQIMDEEAKAREVFVAEGVKRYTIALGEYLRNSELLSMAPGSRGAITLHKGSRALASLEGRDHVIPDDVKFLAPYVFQHRIFLKPEALAEDVTPGKLISEMLDRVPVPKSAETPKARP